jgi:[ribosomal protein S5]-alanine N-acetyltransferase
MRLDDYEKWATANEARLPRQTVFDSDPRPAEQSGRRYFGAQVRRNARLCAGDVRYNFGFVDRARGVLVGSAVVQVVARARDQLGWLGYRIYNHEWRKGYGREGVEAVLKLAFHELELHRVEARIQPRNRPSVRLVRSLGLTRSFRSSLFIDGQWSPIDIYAAHAEEWNVSETRPRVGLAETDGRIAISHRRRI